MLDGTIPLFPSIYKLNSEHQADIGPRVPHGDEGKVRDLADLNRKDEVFVVSDLCIHIHTEGQGFAYTLVYSNNGVLEEDISQLIGQEKTTLTRDEHIRLFNEACRNIVSTIGGYFGTHTLETLFPNITSLNVEYYDYCNEGRISLVVLPFEVYKQFFLLQGWEEVDILYNQARAYGNLQTSKHYQNSSDGPFKVINPEQRSLIVAAETLPIQSYDQILSNGNVTEQDRKDYIMRTLSARFTHEILHSLGFLEEHPSELFRESVTELYSALLHSRINSGIGVEVGYSTGVLAVKGLFDKLEESGAEVDIINKALISVDENSINKLAVILTERYGEETARRLLRFDFRDSNEAYKFISSLESNNFRQKQK